MKAVASLKLDNPSWPFFVYLIG